jgi:hypothetical protein
MNLNMMQNPRAPKMIKLLVALHFRSLPLFTAPLSAAAASAQSRPGKVVVPAVVDQMQQHALEALQALKVSCFSCVHPS